MEFVAKYIMTQFLLQSWVADLTGGLWATVAPHGTSYPLGVYFPIGGETSDTFNSNYETETFQFSLYDNADSPLVLYQLRDDFQEWLHNGFNSASLSNGDKVVYSRVTNPGTMFEDTEQGVKGISFDVEIKWRN